MKNPDGTTKKGAAKNADTNTTGKLSKNKLKSHFQVNDAVTF